MDKHEKQVAALIARFETSDPYVTSAQALEMILPEIEAFPAAEVVPVNFDVVAASTTVREAARLIKPFRAQIVRDLPNVDIGVFDRLRLYALAAFELHGHLLATPTPPMQLNKLREELSNQRQIWLRDMITMVNHGVIPGHLLFRVEHGRSVEKLGFDLLTMIAIFRKNWEAIQGKTFITAEDLAKWERMAGIAIDMGGKRSGKYKPTPETVQLRKRAVSLLAARYDLVRQVMHFLRWKQGDADAFAPSLHTPRSRKKAKVKWDAQAKGETEQTQAHEATATIETQSPWVQVHVPRVEDELPWLAEPVDAAPEGEALLLSASVEEPPKNPEPEPPTLPPPSGEGRRRKPRMKLRWTLRRRR